MPLVRSADPGDRELLVGVGGPEGVFGGPVGVFGGPPSGEGGLRTGEQEESREPSPSERSSGSLPT